MLPAGDFSDWLLHARESLLTEKEAAVDCGECVACCSSFQFIHIRPGETDTLRRIRNELLVAAPGLPKGHFVLGYDKQGHCPMLRNNGCSIYDHRPLTCRTYDCRIFAAAGITAGDGDQAAITRRIRRWRFSYPAPLDREEHEAVKAAAKFIREHADLFPGGKVPAVPSQLALLSIKVYKVFLGDEGNRTPHGRTLTAVDRSRSIMNACRKFDAMMPAAKA